MLKSLSTLLARDLNKLKSEIEAYTDESDLWVVEGKISNSAGTLCLHLCGNLRYFIGAILGQSGYVRDRSAEFNDRDVPRAELLTRIELTIQEVTDTLEGLSKNQLAETFPVMVFSYEMTVEFFLIHLYGHLNYHLGQVNYHRRLLS